MEYELLKELVEEYTILVEYLTEQIPEKTFRKDDRIYIETELFEHLLGKYPFLSVEKKKHFWRGFGFISCDNDRKRYTKKVWIGDKSCRKVVIEREPYRLIKEITEIPK